jgi:hypothetical protein
MPDRELLFETAGQLVLIVESVQGESSLCLGPATNKQERRGVFSLPNPPVTAEVGRDVDAVNATMLGTAWQRITVAAAVAATVAATTPMPKATRNIFGIGLVSPILCALAIAIRCRACEFV